MATGIIPTDEVKELLGHKDFDYARIHEQGLFDKRYPYKYIVFKISTNKQFVELEKKKLNNIREHDLPTMTRNAVRDKCMKEYDEMVRGLPENEGRYILYTLAKKNNTFERVFLFWVGRKASIKTKFVYASTKLSMTGEFLSGVRSSLKNIQIKDSTYPVELREEYLLGFKEK